jgi:hypothetical protein
MDDYVPSKCFPYREDIHPNPFVGPYTRAKKRAIIKKYETNFLFFQHRFNESCISSTLRASHNQ